MLRMGSLLQVGRGVASIRRLQDAHSWLGAVTTAVKNGQFARRYVPDPAFVHAGDVIRVSPQVKGPYSSPHGQTSLLILGPGKSLFVEKTSGVTGRLWDFKAGEGKGDWENIEVLERFDPLGYGSMFFAPFRAKRPGGSEKHLGLISELPFNFKEIEAPSDKHFALRMAIARQSNDPVLLARIHGNSKENGAICREAFSNPHFVHGQAGPGPESVGQFLDNTKTWAGPVKLPGEDLAHITYNYFPFIPDLHALVVPRDPFKHDLSDYTPELMSSMLQRVRDFLEQLYVRGEGDFARQVNLSRMLRSDRQLGPREMDGLVFGWNYGSDTIDMEGNAVRTASASQDQVHFQIGPLAPGSFSIADPIAGICRNFSAVGIDYLGEYLDATSAAKLELADFGGTRVIIPFGQRAIHEMQVVSPKQHFFELGNDDIADLGNAFAFVMQAFIKLGVRSFNMISYIPRFSENRGSGNRIMFAFYPRLHGVAFSEVAGRWVIPSHPTITRNLLDRPA